MALLPSCLRTALHLLLAFLALSLVRYTTSLPRSAGPEEEALRRKALVLSTTTLAGLFVIRVQDFFEHEEAEDEGFREKMDLMERMSGFVGAFLLPHLLSIRTRIALLAVSLAISLVLFAPWILHFVLDRRRTGQEPSLVQFVDRGTQEKKEEAVSLMKNEKMTTRAEEQKREEEERGEPAETWTDILSFSFLMAWCFVCLAAALAMRLWFKMDSPATLFIVPSAITLPTMFFPSRHHRTSLIIITSLAFILHIYASSTYTLFYVRDISSVCDVLSLLNPALGIVTSHRPFECDLARMVHYISTLNIVSFVFRLGVLHSSPMKKGLRRKLSIGEFLESESQ